MADNTINVRIKDRSDTEANWTSKNPVLLKGERAITDGTGKYKIGDGKNTWGALPYYEAMTSADRTKLNDKFASYVPTSRTVNGKALSGNITLSASDIGALSTSGVAASASKLATARTVSSSNCDFVPKLYNYNNLMKQYYLQSHHK